jgi:hypothetical protein
MTVVYGLVRPNDGHIHYVGITENPTRRGRGRDGILVPIRWGLTRAEAIDEEARLIALAHASGCSLTNKLSGGGHGNLGCERNFLWRSRLAAGSVGNRNSRGKRRSPETRARISAAMTGRASPKRGVPMSDEQRAVISAVLRARGRPWRGVPCSPEKRARIAASLRVSPRAIVARANLAAARRGKKSGGGPSPS